jgi:LuxR family transcriptional regulator, maltose regulon positive regulatory protein
VSRPALFGRLGAAARVTVVSAPPGSGKTVLLRSWIAEADMAGRAAWVPVGRGERDPQRFWPAVVGALRETGPASALVRAATAGRRTRRMPAEITYPHSPYAREQDTKRENTDVQPA